MTSEELRHLPLVEIIYRSMISCEPRTAQQGAVDAANAIVDLVRSLERGEYSELPPLGDTKRPIYGDDPNRPVTT